MKRWTLAAAMMLLAIVVGCDGLHERELHLIPDGFIGEVAIVHDPYDGAPTSYEGGVRVFNIPSDGVCRTRGPFTGGWYVPDIGPLSTGRAQYYYVSSDGRRSRIRHVWYEMSELLNSNDSDDEVGIFTLQGRSTFGGSGCTHDVKFESYSVGTKRYFRSSRKPFDPFSYFALHPVRCGDSEPK